MIPLNELTTQITIHLKNPIHKRNGSIDADCPFCGKPAKTGKFNFNPYPKKAGRSESGVYKCFSCDSSGSGKELLDKLSGGNIIQIDPEFTKLIEKQRKEAEKRSKKKFPYSKNNFSIKNKNDQWVKVDPETITEYYHIHPTTRERLFLKIRFINPDTGKKDFRQFYREGDSFYPGLNGKSISFCYNLHKIKSDTVLIVEGEKVTEYVQKFTNHSVIGIPSGASYRLTETDIQFLRGKKVFIFPDYDKNHKGQICAKQNNELLKISGIKSKIVNYRIPGKKIKSGYDIEDFLNESPGKESETLSYLLRKESIVKFIARYINHYLKLKELPNTKGIVIQSIQGTGKTTFMESVFKEEGIKIYIASRQNLADEMSRKFSINSYSEITGEYRGTYSDSLSICLNSITQFEELSKLKIKSIVLDEISLLVDDLFRSDTIEKKDRLKLIAVLKTMVMNAERVYFLDSDIRPSTLHFIEKFLGIEYTHFKNEYTDFRQFFQYHTDNSIEKSIIDTLEAGGKVSIACTSRSYAEKLEFTLRNRFPKLKPLLISKNRNEWDDVKEVLGDHSKISEYDYVIYTPTIFTGNDFNESFGRKTFLICKDHRTVNHFQLMQSTGRFRKSEEVHFFIRKINGTRETDPGKIIDTEKTKLSEFRTMNPDFTINSEPDEILTRMYAVLESEDRESKNNLLDNFVSLAQSRGTKINSAYYKPDESLKMEMNVSGDILEQKRIDRTLEAENIDPGKASKIKNNGFQSEEEFYQYEKYKYLETLGGNEDLLENVIQTKPDLLKSQVTKFENLVAGDLEKLTKEDLKNYSSFIPDNKYISVETKLRREIENILRLISGEKISNKDKNLKNYLTDNKTRIENNLKLKVNINKMGYFIRDFYNSLGLKLDIVLKSGDIRVYQIESESLDLMENIIHSRGGNRTDGQMNLYSTNTTNDLSKKVG